MNEYYLSKLIVCWDCEVSWRISLQHIEILPCFVCGEFSGTEGTNTWKESLMNYRTVPKRPQ